MHLEAVGAGDVSEAIDGTVLETTEGREGALKAVVFLNWDAFSLSEDGKSDLECFGTGELGRWRRAAVADCVVCVFVGRVCGVVCCVLCVVCCVLCVVCCVLCVEGSVR